MGAIPYFLHWGSTLKENGVFLLSPADKVYYIENVKTVRKALIINTTVGQPLLPGLLTNARFFVDTASDTKKGLRLLETMSYDIIVAVENRSSESWQLCRKIKSRTAVPLIVISANASPEDCARAIAAGADYFLRKPFGPREFEARINSLLNRAMIYRAAPHKTEPVRV